MTLEEFRKLDNETLYESVNERLAELKTQNLQVAKNFEGDKFSFTWSAISKDLKERGFALNQTEYKLMRLAKDDEVIISKKQYKEYQELIKQKETFNAPEEKATFAEESIEMLQGKNKQLYVRASLKVINSWREYISNNLYKG